MRHTYYQHVPKILQIEITDACNLNCTYCDHKRNTQPGYMDFGDVSYLVKQATFAETICPQFWGESTLHPQFLDVLRMCRQSDKKTSYYTNGIFPYHNNLKEILRNTSVIQFSMDVYNKEDFIEVRGKDYFDVIKKNIHTCWEIKQKEGLKMEVVIRATRLFKKSYYAGFILYWKDVCDKIYIKPRRYEKVKPGLRLKRDFKCDMVNNHCVIKRNGDMILCCSDHHGEHVVGNVFKESIMEIFNNTRYHTYREKVPNLSICENCWYRYR